jgi:hypothetical protein
VELSGPTFFSHVIEEVLSLIQSKKKRLNLYHVLLILTDGSIHDMRKTIDSIVKGSKEPLSIVIVGIGPADFSDMDYLDSDDSKLVNSFKEPMQRDIVQFV